jgi:hypothetical protein
MAVEKVKNIFVLNVNAFHLMFINSFMKYFNDYNISGILKRLTKYMISSNRFDDYLRSTQNRKGLSRSTVNDVHKLCKQILSYAVKKNFIVENVAAIVETPRLIKKQIQVWTYDQCSKFLTHRKEHLVPPCITHHTKITKKELNPASAPLYQKKTPEKRNAK